jgi:hypothetical protein
MTDPSPGMPSFDRVSINWSGKSISTFVFENVDFIIRLLSKRLFSRASRSQTIFQFDVLLDTA